MKSNPSRRMFLQNSVAGMSALLSGPFILAPTPSSANAGVFAIVYEVASIAGRMYVSSKKVSVPDPTLELILNLTENVYSIHTRLDGIEDSIVEILKKVDRLPKIVHDAIEAGEAKTDAIHLNATCKSFYGFALDPDTTNRQLKEFLFQVETARHALAQRDDLNILSLCLAAHTEIAGHKLIKSKPEVLSRVATEYRDRLSMCDDERRSGSLINLIKLSKNGRDKSWQTVLDHSFNSKTPTAASRPLPGDEDSNDPPFDYENTSLLIDTLSGKWSTANAIAKTAAFYDHGLNRNGGCFKVFYRPDARNENGEIILFETEFRNDPADQYTASHYNAKDSNLIWDTSTCGHFLLDLHHAIYELIMKSEVVEIKMDVRGAESYLPSKFPSIEMSFFESVTYNLPKGFSEGKIGMANGLDDRTLQFGLTPDLHAFPLPVGVRQRGEIGSLPIFDTAAIDNNPRRSTQTVKNEHQRKMDHFNSIRNRLEIAGQNINYQQAAYMSLVYAEKVRKQTERFLSYHV